LLLCRLLDIAKKKKEEKTLVLVTSILAMPRKKENMKTKTSRFAKWSKPVLT
jgi:hypothetical protein